MEGSSHKPLDEVHLTEDGGIIKKILRFGDEDGIIPEKNQEVTVEYEGRLEDGSVFDASKNHGEPLKFIIGVGQVIKGWDVGIGSMKLGEKAELAIKSEYGYGAMGSPPKIPGGATLIFTVELLSVHDRKATRWMMDDPQLIAVATRMKEDGNLKVKDKKYKEAEGIYKEGIMHFESVKNDNQALKDLQKSLMLNLSICLNNTGGFKETLVNCTKVLDIDEKCAKAYYLRAMAHKATHGYDEAIDDIKNAIKLAPGDKNLRTQFEAIKEERTKHNKSQQGAFQKFFSEGVYNDKQVKLDKKETKLPDFDPANPQVFLDIEV